MTGAPLTGFVDGDAQEPSRNIIYLGQGGIGLPDRDYYLKPDPKLREYRTKYQAYIAAALTAAKVPNPAAAARDIVAFETRLARAHWTNVESRDAVKTYNKVAIADLPAQFPGLEWAAWTGELGIAGAPAVVIAQPSFVKALAAAVAATPIEQWKPYLKFHLVDRFAPYLHAAIVNARFDFRGRTLQGVAELQPRWKRAISNLDASVGELLGKIYVEPPLHARRPRPAWTPWSRTCAPRSARASTASSGWARRPGRRRTPSWPPSVRRSATRRSGATTRRIEIRNDDLLGNLIRALDRPTSSSTWARSASRSIPRTGA